MDTPSATNGATLMNSTVEVIRNFPVRPEELFEAFADTESRSQWTAPPGHVIELSESSFKVGGFDVYRCGPKAEPDLDGKIQYLHITPGRLIIYNELLAHNSTPIAISLVTWKFALAEDGGTRVAVISQVCSFIGDDMIEGTREGMAFALGNLAQLFL